MMANRVNVEITGDNSDFKREMGEADKAVSSWKVGVGAATGFVAAELGTRAVGAVTNFARDSINAFSDLNESINAVEVSYGDASSKVLALGDNSAEAFGLSKAAVNEAAVSMAAFAEKIDEADPADAFGNILQRATDFASVMNIDVTEALAVVRSTLAGESEPFRRFGGDVSAAAVAAFAVANGISASASAMTEAEKVQARYGLLMQQTEKFAGDFANTADSLANRQKTLSAAWVDAQALVGQRLEPAMVQLLETGQDLVPVLTTLATAVAEVGSEVLDTVKPLLDIIGFLSQYAGAADDAEGSSSALSSVIGLAIDYWTLYPGLVWKGVGALGGLVGITDDATEATRLYNEETATARDRAHNARRSVEELAEVIDTAAHNTWSARDATDAYRSALRALVDPVARAEQATNRYEEALAKAREEGDKLTEETLIETVTAFGAMQSAVESISPANVAAFRDAAHEALSGVEADIDRVIGGFDSLDGMEVHGTLAPKLELHLHQDLTEAQLLNMVKALLRQGKLPGSIGPL